LGCHRTDLRVDGTKRLRLRRAITWIKPSVDANYNPNAGSNRVPCPMEEFSRVVAPLTSGSCETVGSNHENANDVHLVLSTLNTLVFDITMPQIYAQKGRKSSVQESKSQRSCITALCGKGISENIDMLKATSTLSSDSLAEMNCFERSDC
jgi:hypothetical protein